jgi:hypothetical protein
MQILLMVIWTQIITWKELNWCQFNYLYAEQAAIFIFHSHVDFFTNMPLKKTLGIMQFLLMVFELKLSFKNNSIEVNSATWMQNKWTKQTSNQMHIWISFLKRAPC